MNWYLYVLRNYANFNGRARRKEFWFFALFQFVISFVLAFLDVLIGSYHYQIEIGLISGIYILLTFIPSISVAVRRLHDINFNGWWLLLSFIPLVNLTLLVLYCLKGTVGDNRFGTDPTQSNENQTEKSNHQKLVN